MLKPCAVREGEGRPLLEVRLDFPLVELGLELVGGEDHHQIGGGHRLGDILDREAGVFRLDRRSGTLAQGDGHVDARVLEVVGVGVPLGTVADDGYLHPLDNGQIGVLVVINLHCLVPPRNGMLSPENDLHL